MSVRWKLKERLALKHQLYTLADIQRMIEEKTGVRWSLETISQLVNKTPKALRLKTLQTICSAFQCQLSDICEILPDIQPTFTKLRSYNGHDLLSATSAPIKQPRGGWNRSKKTSGISEEQLDLSRLFPDAKQFGDFS